MELTRESTVTSVELVLTCGSAAWMVGCGAEWFGEMGQQLVKVRVGGVLCNLLEWYLVRFPNAVVSKRTCFSLHSLREAV